MTIMVVALLVIGVVMIGNSIASWQLSRFGCHSSRAATAYCARLPPAGAARVAGDSRCIVCILIMIMIWRGHILGTRIDS